MFPYRLSHYHEEAKRNTIGVVRELATCMDPMLAYPMENEMPLVYHVVERWGCNYIDENNKGLNERTRGHLMLKPKSMLM
jgi:hypothetical protein